MHMDRIGHLDATADTRIGLFFEQCRLYYFRQLAVFMTGHRCQKGNVFTSSKHLVKVKSFAPKEVSDIINRPPVNDLGENYGATS